MRSVSHALVRGNKHAKYAYTVYNLFYTSSLSAQPSCLNNLVKEDDPNSQHILAEDEQVLAAVTPDHEGHGHVM